MTEQADQPGCASAVCALANHSIHLSVHLSIPISLSIPPSRAIISRLGGEEGEGKEVGKGERR